MKWSVKKIKNVTEESSGEKTTRSVFPSPGFPHCSLRLSSPLGLRERLATPQTKVEKKYHGTKALYVTLSSCIDFPFFIFFCVYLTDNIKSLLCVMPVRASEITLASPSPLSFWVKTLSWTRQCVETSAICLRKGSFFFCRSNNILRQTTL